MAKRTTTTRRSSPAIAEDLGEAFIPSLLEAFKAKYDGKMIETHWNIFHMCYVSTPGNFRSFTPGQQAFISGYETAWLAATAIVKGEG